MNRETPDDASLQRGVGVFINTGQAHPRPPVSSRGNSLRSLLTTQYYDKLVLFVKCTRTAHMYIYEIHTFYEYIFEMVLIRSDDRGWTGLGMTLRMSISGTEGV